LWGTVWQESLREEMNSTLFKRTLDDNGAVDINGTIETPSSYGTTSEDIAEFKVASKSTSSTSKPKKVTVHKVVTQKVQTKAFPVKSPVPIKNCILGLAAAHTWACTDRGRKIPILDPPAGIFANHLTSLFECDFVSLDSRLNSKKSTMDHSFGSTEEVDHVRILQSCNSLLVCSAMVYLDWPLILENQVTTKWCKLEAKLGKELLRVFGGPINDPILLFMELPHMLHLEGKIFESCGCLLVCRDDIGSTEFTIYEMMKGSFVWLVRYLVNIVQLLNRLPEGWSIQTGVWIICLGEGEDDAFVVINLSGKVVKYNLISNTNTEIFDIGSNQMEDDDDDDAVLFIPPFEVDPNLYEFIPSLASV
nr:hypothetical protein [Tanacetum cinerariifolium]